jgi:putative oxidoreductase
MTNLFSYLAPLGRVMIALMFIPAGIDKIFNFNQTVGYIASQGLPLPALGAVIAIAVEVFLGLALVVGFKTKWTALILAVFTIATAIFFHAYWAVPQEMKMMMTLMFYKNIAIAGGLLLVAAQGPGKLSIDAAVKAH